MQGIPSGYLRNNQSQIRKVLCSVVKQNNLDGYDSVAESGATIQPFEYAQFDDDSSIHPDDSVSQVEGIVQNLTLPRAQRIQLEPISQLGVNNQNSTGLQDRGLQLDPIDARPDTDCLANLTPEGTAARLLLISNGYDVLKYRARLPKGKVKPATTIASGILTIYSASEAVIWAAKRGEEVAPKLLLSCGCSPSSGMI